MIKKYNKSEFDSRGTKVAIFSSNTCGACRMVKPSLEKLSEEIDVFEINIMINADMAEEYDITALPTIVYFKDGEVVERTTGFVPEPVLKGHIERLVGDR